MVHHWGSSIIQEGKGSPYSGLQLTKPYFNQQGCHMHSFRGHHSHRLMTFLEVEQYTACTAVHSLTKQDSLMLPLPVHSHIGRALLQFIRNPMYIISVELRNYILVPIMQSLYPSPHGILRWLHELPVAPSQPVTAQLNW